MGTRLTEPHSASGTHIRLRSILTSLCTAGPARASTLGQMRKVPESPASGASQGVSRTRRRRKQETMGSGGAEPEPGLASMSPDTLSLSFRFHMPAGRLFHHDQMWFWAPV